MSRYTAHISNETSVVSAFIILLALVSCGQQSEWNRLGFNQIIFPEVEKMSIPDSIIVQPEMMSVNDTSMIIHDYHEGHLFTAVDIRTEKAVNRFGTVGNGPSEIQVGAVGYINKGKFIVYDDNTKSIMTYDPLIGDPSFNKLHIDIPTEANISRLVMHNDSTCVIMGSYRDKYKYALFRLNIGVIDSIVEIIGIDDERLNVYHRSLAEQGQVTISPNRTRLASSTNYSDNIDFISIQPDRIGIIKLNRLRNPELVPKVIANMASQMIPSMNQPIGYIGLSSNDDYVFALYAPHTLEEGGYYSQYILCYSWDGEPIAVLDTRQKIYALGTNNNSLYITTMDKDDLYSIQRINLDNLVLTKQE